MQLERLATPAGVIAGGAYVTQAVLLLGGEQHDVFTTRDRVIEAAFVCALILSTGVLEVLRRRQPGDFRAARRALGAWEAGQVLLTVAAGATLIAGKDMLDIAFVVGFLPLLVGIVVTWVAGLRHHFDPRTIGLLLPVAFVASMLLGDPLGGGIVLGIAWAATGLALPSPSPISPKTRTTVIPHR